MIPPPRPAWKKTLEVVDSSSRHAWEVRAHPRLSRGFFSVNFSVQCSGSRSGIWSQLNFYLRIGSLGLQVFISPDFMLLTILRIIAPFDQMHSTWLVCLRFVGGLGFFPQEMSIQIIWLYGKRRICLLSHARWVKTWSCVRSYIIPSYQYFWYWDVVLPVWVSVTVAKGKVFLLERCT